MTLVSILIPCFNAEQWIGQAIESALGQSWPSKEVIVVDDGSTDRSCQIISKYAPSITFEKTAHRGGNSARNRLLELARGEYLQYLDADDYLLPSKVQAQMDFVANQVDADVVFGPVTLEYAVETPVRTSVLPIPEPHDPWILLARWYLPQTGAALWRKKALLDVGGWAEQQPCCQEHELYLRLLVAGKRFVYLEGGGAVYRQWSDATVCRRDPREVRQRRLDIELKAEKFLRETGQLSVTRLTAINEARFEMARIAWQSDAEEATSIIKGIKASQPGFVPKGKASPDRYQAAYRLVGFANAERIANVHRRIRRSVLSDGSA